MYDETNQNMENRTYHYENASTVSPASAPAPKKKKGNGFFKKLLVGICCGLCFGIFTGIGYQAVSTASAVIKNTTGIGRVRETETITETPQASTKEEEAVANSEAESKMEAGTKEVQDEIKETIEEAGEETKTQIQETKDSDPISTTVTDVTQVVQNVMPAVVSINNHYVETMSFFGQAYSNDAVSTGSGIIVGQNENELLLVSNYHVVASAEELTVQFVDGSQIQAQVKGTDQDKDLAVIAVQIADIEEATLDQIAVAKLGDSSALIVGEPVIAIGNALGYGQSVTTGVVSALNRPIANTSEQGMQNQDQEINTFIQTDAAINPGNSGGALLNIRGEVIGINSNKMGGNIIEGMGYAIPITDAKPIIEDLMQKETRLQVAEKSKGYLGITGVDVVAEYSEVYGIPKGVYISSVMEDSAAMEAGLVKGNIITAVNDEEITSMDQLKEELNYYAAGTEIELTVMQGSPEGYEAVKVTVTLGTQQTNN